MGFTGVRRTCGACLLLLVVFLPRWHLSLRFNCTPSRGGFTCGIYTCNTDNIFQSCVVDKLDIPIAESINKETGIIHQVPLHPYRSRWEFDSPKKMYSLFLLPLLWNGVSIEKSFFLIFFILCTKSTQKCSLYNQGTAIKRSNCAFMAFPVRVSQHCLILPFDPLTFKT